MPFDFANDFVSAITLRSERGIEFLVVNTPDLSSEGRAEADLIRKHLSSFVSCPVVLASRQPSGEWVLFGDRPFVAAFRRDLLDHAKWSHYSLQGKAC
jgi:hypothetical protein